MNLFTSNSEQFGKTFLLVFFIVISFFIIITEIMFRYRVADSHPFEIYKETYQNKVSEIVVFGDSHVANGVQTTDKILNLGYPGNNMISMLYKAVKYVKKNNVKYIVLQADPHLFSYYRIASDQSAHVESLLSQQEPFLYLLKPHLREYLLNYWRSWIASPKESFLDKKNDKKTYVRPIIRSVLDMESYERKKQASIRVQTHLPIEHFQESETALQLINAIEKFLQNGVQICLVTYPVSSDYRFASNAYNEFSEVINFYKTLSVSKGVRYLDYSNSYEDKYFSDADHLNVNGSKLLTKEIADKCFI